MDTQNKIISLDNQMACKGILICYCRYLPTVKIFLKYW